MTERGKERERESSHAKARSIVGVLVSVHVRVIVREGPSLEAGTGVQDLVYTTVHRASSLPEPSPRGLRTQ